jgi:hypothetical protein
VPHARLHRRAHVQAVRLIIRAPTHIDDLAAPAPAPLAPAPDPPFCIGLATEGRESDLFRSPHSLFSNLDHSPLCLSSSTTHCHSSHVRCSRELREMKTLRARLVLWVGRTTLGRRRILRVRLRNIHTTLWWLGRGTSGAVSSPFRRRSAATAAHDLVRCLSPATACAHAIGLDEPGRRMSARARRACVREAERAREAHRASERARVEEELVMTRPVTNLSTRQNCR